MRWSMVALLLVVGCQEPPAPDEGRPVLHIAGTDAVMTRLLPALTETHVRSVGTLDFDLVHEDASDAFRDMLAGGADLVATSRKHMPAEEEQAKANGYSLAAEGSSHIVAVDVVALATHPFNSVDSLSYDQVIGIFCSGSIDSWSFLGLDDRPLRAVSLPPRSGTRALFEDFFCGPSGIHSGVEILEEAALAKALATDPNAVGYLSMAAIEGKVLGLRPDALGPPTQPSQQNIIRGAYPLYHDLYLYSPGPAEGHAADFLDWIASPAGQEVVDEARFVPLFLRPTRLDEPRPLRETIHFEPGSSVPNQRSEARLEMLADELEERAGEYRHIVLEGYTDPHEPNATELSYARAETVKKLLEKDLPGLFFEIIPRGASNPIAPNETPYGRQRNRRVQIYLAEEENAPSIVVEGREGGDAG